MQAYESRMALRTPNRTEAAARNLSYPSGRGTKNGHETGIRGNLRHDILGEGGGDSPGLLRGQHIPQAGACPGSAGDDPRRGRGIAGAGWSSRQPGRAGDGDGGVAGQAGDVRQATVSRGGRRANTPTAGVFAAAILIVIGSGPATAKPAAAANDGARHRDAAAQVALLLKALRQVESKGDDHAVGDGGKSRGPYQIQADYWRDSQGDLVHYRRNVWDAKACERTILDYWRRYCSTALASGDLETLARVHNGGPLGCKLPKNPKAADYRRLANTAAYWRRVQSAMSNKQLTMKRRPAPAIGYCSLLTAQ